MLFGHRCAVRLKAGQHRPHYRDVWPDKKKGSATGPLRQRGTRCLVHGPLWVGVFYVLEGRQAFAHLLIVDQPFDLCVHHGAQQAQESADPHPDQYRDPRPDGAISLIAVAEICDLVA